MKFKLYCVGMLGIVGVLLVGLRALNDYVYAGALIFAGICIIGLHIYMMAIMHDEWEKILKEKNNG